MSPVDYTEDNIRPKKDKGREEGCGKAHKVKFHNVILNDLLLGW
jgi:hypothetical protein